MQHTKSKVSLNVKLRGGVKTRHQSQLERNSGKIIYGLEPGSDGTHLYPSTREGEAGGSL